MSDNDSGNVQVEALRSIASLISAQTSEIRALAAATNEVRERVIRLEEQRHGRDIALLTDKATSIEARLKAVEIDHATLVARFQGAGTMMSVIHKYAPWVTGAIVSIVVFYSNR